MTLSSLGLRTETQEKTKVINKMIVGEVQNQQGKLAEAGLSACQTNAT